MPILDARHDLGHPVEGDSAWSESYYFNAFDPDTNSGFFTRVGVRPNEGTMDVGMSVWLPTGDLAEYHGTKEQREMVDTSLEVGAVRYEMLEAMTTWRLTMDAKAMSRPCTSVASERREVHVALDVTFHANAPAIGTDGQSVVHGSKQSRAAADTTGKGHFEQAGTYAGYLDVDGVRYEWRDARGNRDRSWGTRRWGGPSMWRWFSINIGDQVQFGGIRLGTTDGDLHRGWVWNGERATSVADWDLRTETAEDGLTQKVAHLVVTDKSGQTYRLRGDVLRVANIGRITGTVVNEGLTKWTLLESDGTEHVGYGIAEYLHQLNESGQPVVPVQ